MEDEIRSGVQNRSLVRCGACGCAFAPELLTERDGEIECTFFRCPFCGKARTVSVTDGDLRKQIAMYARLAEQNRVRRLSEPEQIRMQQLKAENAARSRELRRLEREETGPEGE